eukprot:g7852.t1
MAKCVQIFQDIRRAKQIISLKQLAKFADSMGMRTPEAQAMEFFDAIKALDLADHSSPAAQRYFSRFARWAIREFLADAKAAINQAKSLPGHVLERNGCCLQQAHTKVCFEVKMMGEAADAAVNRLKDKTCRVDKTLACAG